MKKTYRSLFCLLAVLLLSVSVLPSASALFSKKLYYYGVVEGISRTVEGKVESILVTAEEQETYQMIVTDSTVWQDHDEKTTSDPATLAVGEQICVVHDPAVMMSLPPQSVAYTVIRNFPAGTDLEQEARDAACPVKSSSPTPARPFRTGSTRPCPSEGKAPSITQKLLPRTGCQSVRAKGQQFFMQGYAALCDKSAVYRYLFSGGG